MFKTKTIFLIYLKYVYIDFNPRAYVSSVLGIVEKTCGSYA